MSRFHRGTRGYQAVRRAALERASWRCEKCLRAGKLDVHHVKPLYRGGEHTLANCIVLCQRHHRLQHRRQPKSPGLPTPERPKARRHPRGGRAWREMVEELVPPAT